MGGMANAFFIIIDAFLECQIGNVPSECWNKSSLSRARKLEQSEASFYSLSASFIIWIKK